MNKNKCGELGKNETKEARKDKKKECKRNMATTLELKTRNRRRLGRKVGK